MEGWGTRRNRNNYAKGRGIVKLGIGNVTLNGFGDIKLTHPLD